MLAGTPSGGASPSRRACCDMHHSDYGPRHTETKIKARGPTLASVSQVSPHKSQKADCFIVCKQTQEDHGGRQAHGCGRKISASPVLSLWSREWVDGHGARQLHAQSVLLSIMRRRARICGSVASGEADALHPSRTCTVSKLKQYHLQQGESKPPSLTDSTHRSFCNF
jgi:hypothetical protein